MKKLIVTLAFILCQFSLSMAQSVTRTQHKAAVTTDVVTTGDMTIRKPDYICIATDGGKDKLIMDGTKFTLTMGGKQHTTDSRKNPQFATFHEVLLSIINGQPITAGEDMTVTTKDGKSIVNITPAKKKRQLFTSFELVVDAKTSAFRTLRMNGRNGDYTYYEFK
jgi:antitoxin (DNA-binding transcriptional repressor) of toxin-antitoxin stability system